MRAGSGARATITSVGDPPWGTTATAASRWKIEMMSATLTPSERSADPRRDSSGPIPPATPAEAPALRTCGATRSSPLTSSIRLAPAGITEASVGVNAAFGVPLSLTSVGSSTLWMRTPSPAEVGLTDIATPCSAGW